MSFQRYCLSAESHAVKSVCWNPFRRRIGRREQIQSLYDVKTKFYPAVHLKAVY